MLIVNDIKTGYEKKVVLWDVSINVSDGEIVSIIGPNGAGKSTLLKAIFGLIPIWTGEIKFNDRSISNSHPEKNIKGGITFCPQGNRVFSSLTVFENLKIGGNFLKKSTFSSRIEEMLSFFPQLKSRLKQISGSLSGGEQQMLALARALITQPKLLIMDEPSLGLSPNLLFSTFNTIRQINQKNKISVLIVEQKVKEVLKISDKVYGIKLGKIVFCGTPNQLSENTKLKKIFL